MKGHYTWTRILKKINWIWEETKQQVIRMVFKFTLSWSPFIEMFCRPLHQPAPWRYLENFTTYERFTNLIESVRFWFEPEPVISVINLYRPQITDETLVIKQALSKNKFARYSRSWHWTAKKLKICCMIQSINVILLKLSILRCLCKKLRFVLEKYDFNRRKLRHI